MKALIAISLCQITIIISLSAQVPVLQVEGFLEVYPSEDATSLYIGKDAGQSHDGPYRANTFVGSEAGSMNTTGRNNSYFGEQAGMYKIMGDSNSFFGEVAGFASTTGNENSFFGKSAGFYTTGNSNSFFGISAGSTITSQSQIIAIGANSGPLYDAPIKDMRLYIDVERSNDPLIYGEFDNNLLRVNGILQLGGTDYSVGDDDGVLKSPSQNGSDLFIVANDAIVIEISDVSANAGRFDIMNGGNDELLLRMSESGNLEIKGSYNMLSDVNMKESFIPIDPTSVLSKISQLPITEWQYKGSTERHIGPMAQDFYSAFGLGQGETTIATVDADGVALASIQALAKENERLQKKEKESEMRISQLEKRLLKLEKMILKSKD